MGRNLLRVPVHFVWATRDRLPLVTENIERRLYRYISSVCQDDRCEVVAINGMPDHVHLLVSMSSTVSLSDLMKHVKGGPSRFISQTLLPGEWFEWQGSDSAFAVEQEHQDRLVAYILNQKRHHAEGRTRPDAEQTHDPRWSPPVSAQADTRREAPPSDEFVR